VYGGIYGLITCFRGGLDLDVYMELSIAGLPRQIVSDAQVLSRPRGHTR